MKPCIDACAVEGVNIPSSLYRLVLAAHHLPPSPWAEGIASKITAEWGLCLVMWFVGGPLHCALRLGGSCLVPCRTRLPPGAWAVELALRQRSVSWSAVGFPNVGPVISVRCVWLLPAPGRLPPGHGQVHMWTELFLYRRTEKTCRQVTGCFQVHSCTKVGKCGTRGTGMHVS